MPENQIIAPSAGLQFADSTLVATSQYDIKLFFGISLPQQDAPQVAYHSIVSLSPQLAKVLAKAIQQAVDDYERDHMELNMKHPPK